MPRCPHCMRAKRVPAEVFHRRRYAKGMRNPYLVTGMLSIMMWVTIRETAFEANPPLAWVATIVLLGWGLFGLSTTLKKKPEDED
jgi:hypothetical protein